MSAAGDIYLDAYSGWYSVRDERFFVESETALVDETRDMILEELRAAHLCRPRPASGW